jgi:hypothetical protein
MKSNGISAQSSRGCLLLAFASFLGFTYQERTLIASAQGVRVEGISFYSAKG